MTVKEELHRLVDELPESHSEELRRFLEDLRQTEIDDEPLTEDDLAAIERGEEDVRLGRAKRYAPADLQAWIERRKRLDKVTTSAKNPPYNEKTQTSEALEPVPSAANHDRKQE